ncbi:hypothetical protein [Jongsikchunia kroppenstedtii]|uniref:hypothetical protein n=1 Tax=Jongsikchunia kroppenstedtii TaxID=1121721 RepID=UPI00039D7AB0|nr:hypothetical protein [Jongsikchunia kroppenstedtii]
MTNEMPTITTVIEGREISRDDVFGWEAARIPAAARKIGLSTPAGDLARQKTAFADAKLELGAGEIRRRLARDIRLTDFTARAMTRMSAGRCVISSCDLHVAVGSAAAFADWFTDTSRDDYARSMIGAHPDHFLIDTVADGRQEVVETTGGSPLATRFLVDYEATASLTTLRDPAFPVEAAGAAQNESGLVIGGVRHQFRDEENGFHARLSVEFPRFTPPYLVAQHRWHLACEFSNWIEAAFADH